MYQEADFDRGSFEVATLFHVLEHLKDPVDDIRRMSEFLKDGGFFAIEVPDILYPGMRFDHKWHDGHLFGFDLKTLEGVVANAGLHTVTLEKQVGNLFGIFQKRISEEVAKPDLTGHHDEALAELHRGKSSYWARPGTYGKVISKTNRSIKEKIAVCCKASGRDILDYGSRYVRLLDDRRLPCQRDPDQRYASQTGEQTKHEHQFIAGIHSSWGVNHRRMPGRAPVARDTVSSGHFSLRIVL